MAQELCVVVSDEDRARLEAIAGDRNRLLKHTQRARIVLLSAERLPVLQVAIHAGVSRPVVWRWQRRYAEAGVDGLLRDKTRPPGKKPVPIETVQKVLALTPTFARAGSAASRPARRPTGPAAPRPKRSGSR